MRGGRGLIKIFSRFGSGGGCGGGGVVVGVCGVKSLPVLSLDYATFPNQFYTRCCNFLRVFKAAKFVLCAIRHITNTERIKRS